MQKAEPKPKQVAGGPPDSKVSQRLMEYINEQANSVECPTCHALSPSESSVCRNCGHRFRDPVENSPSAVDDSEK